MLILTLNESGKRRPSLTAVHVKKTEVLGDLNLMYGDSLERLLEAPTQSETTVIQVLFGVQPGRQGRSPLLVLSSMGYYSEHQA